MIVLQMDKQRRNFMEWCNHLGIGKTKKGHLDARMTLNELY